MPAFHDGYDGLLYPRFINAPSMDIGASTGKRARAYLFRVAQYREVGVVCREDKLDSLLKRSHQFNNVLKDGLGVQVIFRLVDNDYIIITLA